MTKEETKAYFSRVKNDLMGKQILLISPQLNSDGWHDHAIYEGEYTIVQVSRFRKDRYDMEEGYFKIKTKNSDGDIVYFVYDEYYGSFTNVYTWGDGSWSEDSLIGILKSDTEKLKSNNIYIIDYQNNVYKRMF